MSSYVVAVLEDSLNAYLITPTKTVNIIKSAKTAEEAAFALRRAITSVSVKRAIVVSDAGLEPRQSCVNALQKAGFINVEVIDSLSIKVSSCIINLPLQCEIDEPVFVYIQSSPSEHMPVIIKKCTTGFQIIKANCSIDNVRNEHPSVRNLVLPKCDKSLAPIRTLFPGTILHEFTPNYSKFKEIFIRNRINKAVYEVLPYCGVYLSIVGSNKCGLMELANQVPPFSILKEFDVRDADDIKAYIYQLNSDVENIPLLKQLYFKDKAHRNVLVKVTVDETLLPQVTFRIGSTYKPPEANTSFIYKIEKTEDFYKLEAVFPDRVVNEGYFKYDIETVSHMFKTYSQKLVADIYYVVTEKCCRSDLRDFRSTCKMLDFSNVNFITAESLYLSLLLDRAKISIKSFELIGVVSSKWYRVIGRDGKFLKIVKRITYAEFDAKKSKVTTVIIDNSENMYTKTDLAHMHSTFSDCVVHVISEEEQSSQISNYFWSRLNGDAFGGNVFNNFGDFNIMIKEHGKKMEEVDTRFAQIPYVVTALYPVSIAKLLKVYVQTYGNAAEEIAEYDVTPGLTVELTVSVKTACDITVDMRPVTTDAQKVEKFQYCVEEMKNSNDEAKNDDNTDCKKKKKKKKTRAKPKTSEPDNLTALESDLSKLILKPPPSAVLTFTSDNRVIIEADETYTGTKELLAYVRLRIGKPPETGKVPFSALKKDSGSVFYDITRLLATDFDPDHPDPAWGFKTSRGADGKVILHTRNTDDITTFPLVLFGIVIRSTLLYIREHSKSKITSLGLKLPKDSSVSDAGLNEVSKRVGVDLYFLID